jgi:hypothetical protein
MTLDYSSYINMVKIPLNWDHAATPLNGFAQNSGTLNLPGGGRTETGGFPLALRGDARFGDLAPRDDRPGTKRPIAG